MDDPSPLTGPTITSAANPRVKALLALRKRRTRDSGGVTLLEGLEETTPVSYTHLDVYKRQRWPSGWG